MNYHWNKRRLNFCIPITDWHPNEHILTVIKNNKTCIDVGNN